MAIDDRYLAYLDHLGSTVPVVELADDEGRQGVALRHDVDHDLDVALEMAFWEHQHGARATYFLLHGAPYWDDPALPAACRQLAALGHEVGLHSNALTLWWNGQAATPAASIADALERLRGSGVPVVGSAAHGDRACYANGFINYWTYADLRPADEAASEGGLSAEGVPHPGGAGFAVPYPDAHELRRPDGDRFPLWSVAMGDLGLAYEAVKVPTDGYFTDSGGSWLRSPDPLDADLSRGRHQVLVHPEYWRGPQRLYLFLSTARSGSTWLARVLDEASSVTARHELTLNHRWNPDDGLVPDKRTGAGFVELLEPSSDARRLMAEARGWMQTVPGDVAEANVYLAHFPELVREVFPDAVLVHLHRDPRLVVASVLQRGWYDSPHDDRHPEVGVPGWSDMDQLERACWYVHATTTALLDLTPHRLALADATASRQRLVELLTPLGIAVHVELAEHHDTVVNGATGDGVTGYDAWPQDDRRRFDRILGPLRARLGYSPGSEADVVPLPQGALAPVTRTLLTVAEADLTSGASPVGAQGVVVEQHDGRPLLAVPSGDRHAHLLLGGGTWKQLEDGQGWPSSVAGSFRLRLDAATTGGTVQVFCLMYDEQGAILGKRLLGRLTAEPGAEYGFRTRPDAARFDIALYAPVSDLPASFIVQGYRLEREDVSRSPAGVS